MGIFGFGKQKNQCKEVILQGILTNYQNAVSIKNIISGKEETPEGYDADDVFNLLIELSNTVNPLILEIENCDVFSNEEAAYWIAHLYNFSGANLRQSGDIEINNAISYYEAAIEAFKILESEFPYPYYDIPNLINDLNNYAYDTPHLAQTRREYASLVSDLGDEDKTEKIIIENVRTAKKGFEVNQDAFLTYAETLWQANQFYMLNNPKEAVEYAEESVNIVEQRADLKTHIENNDLTLLRYKLTYLISLQKNENWDLADKLMTELKEYDEYKPKAHESPIIEHIQPQGSFTCEIKILKKIQKIHNNRNSLEQTASEYSDDEVLELINQSLNEISEAIQEIEKCEEISPYWEAHLLGFMGYIYARKSDNYQSGKYYQESFELFEKIEKKYPISYYPFDEITDIAGGYFFNSVKSRLGYATSIEDDKKADKEFLKVVEMAEKKYPNDEHRTLTVALRKTGQRFSFPFRRNEEDCKRAIDLFKKGINVLEKEGDLEEFISNGDTTLLFFKDWLKSNLEHYGSKAESEEIKNEIKPYEEYISWRFERNPLTEEDE